MARKIYHYTNRITDNVTRRAVYDCLNYFNLEKLDGISSTAAEIDYRCITAPQMSNVSVAKSVYVVTPYTGNLTTIYAVLTGTTLAPTPDVFSFGSVTGGVDVKLSGNTITVSTGTTVATSSSVTCTAGAKAVTAGDVIRFSCNGGSTGPAMHAIFTALIDIT